MAGLFRLQNSSIKTLLRPLLTQMRAISTSKKNSDTATVSDIAPPTCKTTKTDQNWMSYGFDFKDETADKRATHSIFFFAVTICMIFGGFIWTYIPDYQLRDWAQREAYLELRRREKDGLPLVDPNLIDPAAFTLPEDDELGATEIII